MWRGMCSDGADVCMVMCFMLCTTCLAGIALTDVVF